MLRVTPIPRVVYRQNLLFGGQRIPVLALLLMCIGLGITSSSIEVAVICSLVYLVGMFFLKWMAKYDPYLIDIYRRYSKYSLYYPPRPTPWQKKVEIHTWGK